MLFAFCFVFIYLKIFKYADILGVWAQSGGLVYSEFVFSENQEKKQWGLVRGESEEIAEKKILKQRKKNNKKKKQYQGKSSTTMSVIVYIIFTL